MVGTGSAIGYGEWGFVNLDSVPIDNRDKNYIMNSVPNINSEQKMCPDFSPNKILNFDRYHELSYINVVHV